MMRPAHTRSERLREATRSRHDAIEELAFFRRLRNHELPRQSVISYLRGLGIVHATLETSLVRCAGDSFGPWKKDHHAHGEELRATLAAAEAAGVPDIPRAIDAAIRIADHIIGHAQHASTLLGHLYVLEGSQRGGQVLRRHFAAALELSDEQVVYFPGDTQRIEQRWATFKQELDDMALSDDDEHRLIEAAKTAFDGIAELAMAAFPFEPAELRHRVTAINPEAGRHAMPQSDTEIARALRCAAAAWKRYPYLEARYGERGRRFTQSDSCWLVSLYDMDEAVVVKSLRWLRGVLAGRGLPSCILVSHLQVIDEDIRRDDAQRAGQARGFRTVINHFQAECDIYLPPAVGRDLTERWQQTLDACAGPHTANAAELLIAARVDTAIGMAEAWKNTAAWFRDPARFSSEWIAAVEALADELEENIVGSGK